VSLHVKVGGKWVEITEGAGGGGSSGPTWAKVTGGTVTTYTKPNGDEMEVHTFLADGTLTVDTPGYAEVLVIGGGGHGFNNSNGGGGGGGSAGRCVFGLHEAPAGPQAVVVGAAGAYGERGAASKLGNLTAPGGDGGNQNGSRPGAGCLAVATERAPTDAGGIMFYGVGYGGGCPGWDNAHTDGTYGEPDWGGGRGPRENSGAGGRPGGNAGGAAPGAKGIVIVAVQTNAPAAGGGGGSTVTDDAVIADTPTGTYTDADGTWKYLTIDGPRQIEVTKAGLVDVLVVGGGGGGGISTYPWGGFRGGGGGGGGAVRVFPRVNMDAGPWLAAIGRGGDASSGVGQELASNGGTTTLISVTGVGGFAAPGGGYGGGCNYETGYGPSNGSSGGGSGHSPTSPQTAIGIPGLGFAGGNNVGGAAPYYGSGGGGAGGVGGSSGGSAAAAGGAGIDNGWTGAPVTYGRGGGSGGAGDGGGANTGRGGGGSTGGGGGAGGSGRIVLRWKA
jgi:hypothetical protein